MKYNILFLFLQFIVYSSFIFKCLLFSKDVGYVYDMTQAFRLPMAISGANSKRKEFMSNKSASVIYDNLKEMSQIKMAESVTTDINLPSFKVMKKRWFNFGASVDHTGKQNIEDFSDNVSVRWIINNCYIVNLH